jgi:hypothetical protein
LRLEKRHNADHSQNVPIFRRQGDLPLAWRPVARCGRATLLSGAPQDSRDWQKLCAALEARDDIVALESGARHGFQRFAVLLED